MTSGTCCRTRRSASSWTNGKATLKELRELTQLHKLKVAGVSYGNSNELWCAIAGHNQLQSLSVEVEDVSEERYQLDGCLGEGLLPPSYLESLTLCGKLVSITKWIHKLQNLSRLVLTESELEQDDAIQAVGFLPNLAVLRLRANSFMGTQLHFQSSSFPSLVVLELVGLDHIQSVLFEEDAMTKLELLQVDWCQSLGCDIELNVFSGLPALKSLKEIRLGCNGVRINVKEEVQRQVAEHLKHVRLNII